MIHASKGQYLWAGTMALMVHGLLFAGLVVSVSWRSLPQLPVYADLWTELPAPAEPPPPEEGMSEPPVPVEPAPVVQPEPDIALQAKEAALRRERLEQARQQEEARKAAEEVRRQEERQRAEEARKAAEEARRQEEAREQARRELEEDLARQMREELARETSQIKRKLTAQTQSIARAQMIHDYQERIRSKIRGYLRLPLRLTGNPEVVYQVRLLPDGEVLKLNLVKSSGQAAYDEEVERAILKASPLPLPPDREAAAAFRDGLILKFRPREEETPS